MKARLSFVCVMLLLVFNVSMAQTNYLLTPDGKLKIDNEVRTITSKIIPRNQLVSEKTSVLTIPDTLTYRDLFNGQSSNFGFFAREIAVQWFQAPRKMRINAIGFAPYANPGQTPAELKIVKLNWTRDQLDTAGIRNWGYYPATGNGLNNISGFCYNPDVTGPWFDISRQGVPSPFGDDLWSDGGIGAPIVPNDPITFSGAYQWVECNLLAMSIIVEAGEIFGVVLTNIDPNYTEPLLHRIGINSAQTNIPPAFKFYSNGRFVTGEDGDKGWWTIDDTWDMVVAVEIEEGTQVNITNITQIPTTGSTSPQTILATIDDGNPTPGVMQPIVAKIQYKIYGNADWFTSPMTQVSSNVWSGNIPGQLPGSLIFYSIEVDDSNGTFITESLIYHYAIFQPNPMNKTLVVFNGYNFMVNGFPQTYYFGNGTTPLNFNHDVWAYGPLTEQIVNNYFTIFEITNSSSGPDEYNDDVIRTWLSDSPRRSYFLAGQEWLGARYGYVDKTFSPGSFEYDILGITHSYNDVSFANSTGQTRPSRLIPIANSLLGDSLNIAFLETGADSLIYDYVANWIDAYDVLSDVSVDVKVETRGIDNVVNVQNLPAVSHRSLSNGNVAVFMSYDPLYVNTTAPNAWLGFSSVAPQVQALNRFRIDPIPGVKNGSVPQVFSVSQNFPNPFNPSTKIKFNLPEEAKVSLKIFDILGQEVFEHVNVVYGTGVHEVQFNGANLNSGVYFYKISAEGSDGKNFSEVNKMLLLK